MTTQPESLTRLLAALDGLSAALVTGLPDAVLAAEESLGAAVRHLNAHRPAAGDDPAGFVDTIRAIRVAVYTCERLGRSSSALMQATVPAGPYGSNGQMAPSIVPSTLASRT